MMIDQAAGCGNGWIHRDTIDVLVPLMIDGINQTGPGKFLPKGHDWGIANLMATFMR